MAALRCRGELDDEGVWRITGEKTFITSGHGEWHYVIARTEAATDAESPLSGLEGLSMFMVPAHVTDADGSVRRQVEIARLEEKLGHHASATCALAFDGARAELIGKRGEGFRYMLILMNNARLGVGFEALGLSECAYRIARDYAAERRSMGKTIDRHEMLADYLDEMKSDIEAVRAIGVTAAQHEEIAQKLAIQLRFQADLSEQARADLERRRKRHSRKSRRLTPLLKFVAAENAVKHARLAVQILGGVGYTREYGAEKLLRDAMVLPIYEGTSQIQALMAMKDTLMGMVKAPKRFLARLAEARVTAISARDPLVRSAARVTLASLSAQQHLLLSTAADKAKALRGKPLAEWPERFLKNWDPKRDFRLAMLHAERLARLLTHEVVVEILLEQAERHPERREVLARYLSRAELRARHEAETIHEYGERILRSLEEPASLAAE
jgi:alkylation response protein AidB-like acyl-CoA dehydrogenase